MRSQRSTVRVFALAAGAVLGLTTLAPVPAAAQEAPRDEETEQADPGVVAYLESVPEWEAFVGSLPGPTIGRAPIQSRLVGCTEQPFTRTTDELKAPWLPRNLWVGELLSGASYASKAGLLDEFVFKQRAPINLSIDLLTREPSQEVTNPSRSSFQQAIGELIARAEAAGLKAPGKELDFQMERGRSFRESILKLGFTGRYLNHSVETSLDAQRSLEKNTVAAALTELAFTVTMDPPPNPWDVFGSAITKRMLEDQGIGPDDPPLYVESVTYGRVLFFTVTSDRTFEELEAAVGYSYDGGLVDASATAAGEYRQLLANSKVEVQNYGGGTGNAAKLMKSGRLEEYFSETPSLNEYVPIAYTVRSLKDNEPAAVRETTYVCLPCLDGEKHELGAWWDGSTDATDPGQALDVAGNRYTSEAVMEGNDPGEPGVDMIAQVPSPTSGDEVFRLNWQPNRTDQYLHAPSNPYLAPRDQKTLMLAAWVNWRGPQDGEEWQRIVIKGTDPARATYSLDVKEDGSLRAGVLRRVKRKCVLWGDDSFCADKDENEHLELVTTQNALSRNKWHHVVVTFAPNNLKIYVNGELLENRDLRNKRKSGQNTRWNDTLQLVRNDEPVEIGGDGSAAAFRGYLDDIQVARVALDKDAVETLYDSGFCRAG